MMHILRSPKTANRPPSLLWREQVQATVRDLLTNRAPDFNRLDRDGWLERKRQWQALMTETRGALQTMRNTPVTARVISETAHDGFRLQRIVLETFPGGPIGLDLFLPVHPGPYVPILCPCGHGPKWMDDHQLPPQVLARRGFAAALFDMPMFGECGQGNNHFIQGVQAWTVGLWSNLFFLIGPLRVADYLETRSDIDVSHGFGATGVSGGGYCTLCLQQVDDRIAVTVPVCCVSSFSTFITDGLYTGCPENYLWGQAATGMDMHHLVALGAPRPCLVLAGTKDDLFTPDNVRHAVDIASRTYALEGVSDRLSLAIEDCPHKYTASMAERAAQWFSRWLKHEALAATEQEPHLLSEQDLDCGTADTATGMWPVIDHEANRLKRERTPQTDNETLLSVLGITMPTDNGTLETVAPPSRWGTQGLSRKILRVADDLPLPIFEVEHESAPPGAVLLFSEKDKWLPLKQVGGFFGLRRHMASADLRGFGELEPEPTDYDLYSWCSIDRSLCHLLYLCGQTALGQQTTDALRVMTHMAGRYPDEELTVYGSGEAALPALFAALLYPRVGRIILHAFPCSFEALTAHAGCAWRQYVFLSGVLRHFDLPELVRARSDKKFLLLQPLDGQRQALDESEAIGLYGAPQPHVSVRVIQDESESYTAVSQWMNR